MTTKDKEKEQEEDDKDETEEEKTLATSLCRGVGHAACEHCYFVDDRFGRNMRCRRKCKMVGGLWGPAICGRKCVARTSARAIRSDQLESLD